MASLTKALAPVQSYRVLVQYKKVCQSSHAGPSAPGAQVLLKHLRHKWDQRFSHAAQEVKVRLR
jgi:hypothetical protein